MSHDCGFVFAQKLPFILQQCTFQIAVAISKFSAINSLGFGVTIQVEEFVALALLDSLQAQICVCTINVMSCLAFVCNKNKESISCIILEVKLCRKPQWANKKVCCFFHAHISGALVPQLERPCLWALFWHQHCCNNLKIEQVMGKRVLHWTESHG